MSRPSPTPHEISMSMRALRAHYDKVPDDIRPHEPDPDEEEVKPAPVSAAPISVTPEVEKTSDPQSDKQRGSYKTRDSKA